MNRYLWLFCLVIPFVSRAQTWPDSQQHVLLSKGHTNLSDVRARRRITYAVTFSPTWHHRDLTTKPAPGQDPMDPAVASHQGYSVGLTAYYSFTPTWSVSAGSLLNNSSGFSYLGSAENYAEQFQNLQLPLLVNYRLSKRRLSPFLSTGLLFDYLYHVKRLTLQGARPGFVYDQTQSLDNPAAFRPYTMLGVGVSYQFMPTLALHVQSTGAYSLKRYAAQVESYHEYQLGIQAQLKFSL